jgi:hypothetical protein
MAFSMDGPEAGAAFEALFALDDDRAELRAVRDKSMSYEIPNEYLNRPPRDENEQSEEELRQKFEKEAKTIRNGSNLAWLSWAAQIYLGLFLDSDEQASPHDRLMTVLGEGNARIAVEGFIAALSRPDVPSLANVIDLATKHQRYDWWHVLTAGLIERWEANPSVAVFSDDFLKGMLVFDLSNPMFEEVDGSSRVVVPNWKAALIQDRPELVRDAYMAIARAELAKGDQTVDGLRELMSEDALKPFREDTALQLLRPRSVWRKNSRSWDNRGAGGSMRSFTSIF